MKQSKIKEFLKKHIIFVITVGVITIALIVLSTIFKDAEASSRIGQFLSGTVGILLSFLALVGIFIAYLSQKDQLELQQQEICDNQIFFRTQILENNFYRLLDIWLELKKDIKEDSFKFFIENIESNTEKHIIDTNYKGERAFEYILDLVKEKILLNHFIDISKAEYIKRATANYSYEFTHYYYMLFPYYKIIYQIFELIYNERNKIMATKKYSNILRSQFGRAELLLFFFYSLTHQANSEISNDFTYKKFIENYKFFEFIDLKYFEQEEDFKIFLNEYAVSAYDIPKVQALIK